MKIHDVVSKICFSSHHSDLCGSIHVCCVPIRYTNREFSHDVTAAILVFQNKGMVVMLVYQVISLGIKVYFYATTSFVNQYGCWSHE